MTTRLETIEEGIERCEYILEGGCFHCKDKADLVSIACAWAFEQGRDAHWILLPWQSLKWEGLRFWEDKHICLLNLDATGKCFQCGDTP